jgi:tol-pal system protein YbgF
MNIMRTFSLGAMLSLVAAGAGCVDGSSLEKQLAANEAELARARRESLEARAALAECREEKSDRAERAQALAPLAAAVPPPPAPAGSAPPEQAPAPSPAQPAASAAPEMQNEEESYRAALALINARQIAAARAALDRFMQRFPDSKLRTNAAFWRAEADFLEGQWAAARTGFSAISENFPNHPKAADSLYKAALCSLNLGDKSLAIQQLNDVLKRFPRADAAGFAQKKLAELSKKT